MEMIGASFSSVNVSLTINSLAMNMFDVAKSGKLGLGIQKKKVHIYCIYIIHYKYAVCS